MVDVPPPGLGGARRQGVGDVVGPHLVQDGPHRLAHRPGGEGLRARVDGHGTGQEGLALVLVECLTDNRNRAASDVRLGFTRHGGSLADPGSVSYLFSRRGVVEVPAADGVDEESIMMAVLDAGAEEVEDAGELFVIESDPKDVVAVRSALQEAGIDYDSAEVQFVASTEVELDLEGALKVNKLIDALEDSDDVQNIYTNMSLSDEVRAQLEEAE